MKFILTVNCISFPVNKNGFIFVCILKVVDYVFVIFIVLLYFSSFHNWLTFMHVNNLVLSESDVEESPKPVSKKNKSSVVEVGKTNTATTPAKSKDKAQNENAVKVNTTTPPAKNKDKAQNEKNTPKPQAAPVAAAAQPKVLHRFYLAGWLFSTLE